MRNLIASMGLISLEAEAIGLPAYREGIEFLNSDFIELARACGGHGFRASKPDEMPNFPHLELEKVDNHALAKIKEAVLSVTSP